jgi:hypothetical protein
MTTPRFTGCIHFANPVREKPTKGDYKMSELSNNTASASKAPSHSAYHVRNRKAGDAIWTRIGSAWPHADGKGFNIQIETVPLDGRISLRVPSERAE